MLYEQQFINKTIVQSILAYKRKKILKQSYSIGYMLAIKEINVHFAAEGVSIWCMHWVHGARRGYMARVACKWPGSFCRSAFCLLSLFSGILFSLLAYQSNFRFGICILLNRSNVTKSEYHQCIAIYRKTINLY